MGIMEVYGNSVLIANGDASPSAGDHTDFGSTPVATTVTRTFTIENVGDADLESIAVAVPSGYTLTVAPDATLAPAASTTFSVRFDASTGATFAGNITISSNVDDYTFAITALAEYVPIILETFTDGVWGPGSFTRDCDVGQLTVTDTASNTSISAGELRTTNFVGFDNPKIETANQTRAKGLTLLVDGYDVENDRSYLRWRAGGVEQVSLETGLNSIQIGGQPGGSADLGGAEQDAALVLDTVGGGVYSRLTGSGDFILRWLDQVSSTTPLLGAWSAITNSAVEAVVMDSFRLLQDVESILLTPTINVASPVNMTVYEGTSSAINDIALTAPGSLGVEAGLRFRVQDDDNYWRAYFNNAGAFVVDLVTGGSPANQIPAIAGVITTGAARRIRVRCTDTTLDFYTKNGTAWTKRGGTLTSSVLQGYSDVVPEIGAGWTGANLRSDPTYSPEITALLNAWLAIQP